VQRVRLTELSDEKHTISWDLIDSEPPIEAMSVSHTLTLRRVTKDDSTYIEWITDFSAGVSQVLLPHRSIAAADGSV
jgi:hypothetical protein